MNPAPLYAWFRQHPTVPIILFVGFALVLGVIALVSALRSGTGSVDTVIKVIAGWAALIFAIFGPLIVFTYAWGRLASQQQKTFGVVFVVLASTTIVWLLLYVLRRLF